MQAAHAGQYWMPKDSWNSAGKMLPFGAREHGTGEQATKDRAARARRAAFNGEAMPCVNDLFRSALRMTGDRARAEDAVQETMLQAWKSFDRFQSGSNCRAWLYKI